MFTYRSTICRVLGLFLTLVPIIVVVQSCKSDDEPIIGGTALYFVPFECTQIQTLPLEYNEKTVMENGHEFIQKSLDPLRDGVARSSDFVLWMMTGTESLKNYVSDITSSTNAGALISSGDDLAGYYSKYNEKDKAPSILSLERQLDYDFQNNYSNHYIPLRNTGYSYMNLKYWTYRVTGVKDFRIEASSTLFGLPAGSPLNKYFKIFSFQPRQVISYRSQKLIFGYGDKEYLEDISKWLSLQPMAPPLVMFRFRKVPKEIPGDFEFITILETTDNKVLRDTIQVHIK